MKRLLLCISLLLLALPFFGQRSIEIQRTDVKPKIDGFLDDWNHIEGQEGFIQNEPKAGDPATLDTKIKLSYDDEALYIAAFMYDPEPDKIVRNLTERDDLGINDWFFIVLDTYKKGLNAVGFGLTPAGVQIDIQYVTDNEDDAWDAVWKSATQVVDDGWQAEMAIPYSALRFPESQIQEWAINFSRRIRRKFEVSNWEYVDPNIEGFINQTGTLKGIQNIKPPVRLSFTPFVVLGQQISKDKANQSYGAGMDLKYGINDAFTLDMTVIPDFSQVRSDDQVLNLSPFEVQFNENRPFFTEGTDIFNKGNFFYSRRIGEAPFFRQDIINQEGLSFPDGLKTTAQLINATKISGRMQNGTGLGFFNAIEARSFTKVTDSLGNNDKLLEHPLTNYNVSVWDQSLKNNSFFSLVNTNVMRQGAAYDANLTGAVFQFRDADQKFQVQGKAALSQKYFTNETDLGHTYFLEVGEIKGKFRSAAGFTVESDNYDPNDLGFLFSPNERSAYLFAEYREFKPKQKKLQRYSIYSSMNLDYLHKPFVYNTFEWDLGFFNVTKNFVGSGFNISWSPFVTHDYFEPRTADFSKYYIIPSSIYANAFVSTDYSKTLALNLRGNVIQYQQEGRNEFGINVEPRWTISTQALLIPTFSFTRRSNDEGYVNKSLIDDSGVIFGNDVAIGRRQRDIWENSISFSYIFTNRMASSLRVRHYWDVVDYNRFFVLSTKGLMYPAPLDTNEGQEVYNTNSNYFNIDLNYEWRFAPGSDIIFAYRSQAFLFNGDVESEYFENLNNTFTQNNTHRFSLKVLYFLDYHGLKTSLSTR